YRKQIESLKSANIELTTKHETNEKKIKELQNELSVLQNKHSELSIRLENTVADHSETVKSLKIHAETLAQCYRQQISEQEARHNKEIIELQSKIEKAPSPVEHNLPPLPMHREEGEGSENTDTTFSPNTVHPVPLERLLTLDDGQELSHLKKLLQEQELKLGHLTALLADTEQDLAKHIQMNEVLKEEIRRQQRSQEREEHAENLEYLKNVVFKFLTLGNSDERSRLVPVLNTILKLSPDETKQLVLVAKGESSSTLKGWTNLLPTWSSTTSKP
ncbi:unnamed protein product, partial [Callosobruchus maculatus]